MAAGSRRDQARQGCPPLALGPLCRTFLAPTLALTFCALVGSAISEPENTLASLRGGRSAAATWPWDRSQGDTWRAGTQGGDTLQPDTRQESQWQGGSRTSGAVYMAGEGQKPGQGSPQEEVQGEVEGKAQAEGGPPRRGAVVVSLEELASGDLPGPENGPDEAPSSEREDRQGLGSGRRRLWSDIKWEYREVKRRRRGGDCWSQNEQHLFYKSFPMTEELEEALRSYEEMHRRCTNVTDWNHEADMLYWDKEKDRGTLKGCQYVIFVDPLGHGLGNRIINLISTFAYALVTKRAILMKDDSPIFDFFCNPFKHSSWGLGTQQWKGFIDNLWKGVRRINAIQEGNIFKGWTDRRMMHVGVNWNSAEVAGKFFCPENHEQIFKKIPVISIESDEYYIPALYYIPELATELQRLMPDGRVFLHLSRYLLHPTNRIWLQITRFYDAYLSHHSRLVGIQVRSFWPCDDPVESRILDCAFNVSGAVPEGIPTQEFVENLEGGVVMQTSRRGRESVGVFVTSLNRTYADILADYASARVPPEGQLVAVYSLSHEGHEKHDYKQYEVALVEMMLLSLCDELLTTDYSTFGYVAAGVSGTLPYSMNIVVTAGGDFRTNKRPVCQAISSEPCFHRFPSDVLTCKDFSKPIAKIHPDVDVCDAVGTGLMHKITV